MKEGPGKPKILLLRNPAATIPDASDAALWSRLSKALRTFTDLEERESSQVPEDLIGLTANFDYTFLDEALAPWPILSSASMPGLALVRAQAFPWNDLRIREERLNALSAHPLLVLDGLGAAELLRLVHLFLIPKRLAGVTPLMEKGSLILGEKVMEKNAVGQLLDRVCTFCEKLNDFTLGDRLPDLRQVLSALLLEGLGCAGRKSALYPFVDFQLAVGPKKLAVNLRFPLGGLPLHTVTRNALSGADLFWQQVWQCSDATVLTHHITQDELEVTLLLCRAERYADGRFRAFLHKTSASTSRAENLLDPPQNFRFLLVSEIQAQENADIQLFSQENPLEGLDGLETQGLPESVISQIRQLTDQCRVLNDHVRRKDEQIQNYLQKNQQITREANSRRSELIRAEQSRETLSENSERKIRELEATIAALKAAAENPNTRSTSSMHEMVTKMETTLRSAESEKNHLRDNITHEQRRASMLEQKYSQLYKDLAAKDREAHELRNTINKLRREVSDRPAKIASDESKDSPLPKLKELEERETALKQEVKKLSYKVETQEKNLRAVQTDATEKQRLFDQKIRAAKTKEVELLNRIEELTTILKKANKVA